MTDQEQPRNADADGSGQTTSSGGQRPGRTTAVLGLATVLDPWLAALVVAVVLLAATGIAALLGKNKVAQATPAKPERAVVGIKDDIATVMGGHQ